jgi:hypothetical protein
MTSASRWRKFYLTQTGEEIANPFPYFCPSGAEFFRHLYGADKGQPDGRSQDRGSSPIEVWDTGSGQLLATIDDPFVVRQVNLPLPRADLSCTPITGP